MNAMLPIKEVTSGATRDDLRRILDAALPSELIEAERVSRDTRDRREVVATELMALTQRLNSANPSRKPSDEESALTRRLSVLDEEVRQARATLRAARESTDSRRLLQNAALRYLRRSVPQLDLVYEVMLSLAELIGEPDRVATLHGLQPPQLGIAAHDVANLKRFADLLKG
jgi:hypothetical protein